MRGRRRRRARGSPRAPSTPSPSPHPLRLPPLALRRPRCQRQFSQYTCPRCNTRYCSVQCYKVTESNAVDAVELALKRHSSDMTTRAMSLIALLKLSSRFLPTSELRRNCAIVEFQQTIIMQIWTWLLVRRFICVGAKTSCRLLLVRLHLEWESINQMVRQVISMEIHSIFLCHELLSY